MKPLNLICSQIASKAIMPGNFVYLRSDYCNQIVHSKSYKVVSTFAKQGWLSVISKYGKETTVLARHAKKKLKF